MEPIVGIDLGTTNSEVAFVFDGHVQVIRDNDDGIVPSCVGVNGSGKIVVGREARNQALIAPQSTALSVKRIMGTDQRVKIGKDSFSPQEVSAFILKALKQRAQDRLGQPVNRAIITVPAYFTDAQRQATREAGQIAGLEVVRIINEPTAAALAYEIAHPQANKILIYDLGGGTFDVSIVAIEDGVVEVLASTGDNHLGGDDFDQKIVDHLAMHLQSAHQFTVGADPLLQARLKRAAEAAKIELSSAPFARIEEDHLGKNAHGDVHLSLELSRMQFEEIIGSFLEQTIEAVNRALEDAGLLPSAIDKIILVGGSTRIPRISAMLEEKFNRLPHSEIDPDLCVAIGAGLQAAREMGLNASGVLVDITPYSFGTSAIGEIDGLACLTRYVPLIRRNTKLPVRKSEVFYTMVDHQKAVDVSVYQGEAKNALDNVRLGNYLFELTPAPAGSEIVLHYELDVNGILKIRAMEKNSGKHIDAQIENAIRRFSDDNLDQTRRRIDTFWEDAGAADRQEPPAELQSDDRQALLPEYADVIARARAKLDQAPEEDRDEMIGLIETIYDALQAGQTDDAEAAKTELEGILFYLG